MRPLVVIHYLGILLGLQSLFMVVPFLASLYYQEHDQLPLLASALATALVGGSLWRWTRKQPGPMLRRESFLVVALAWALASVFGALPFLLAGTFTNPVDAYFEAMGGFSTTGASVLSDIEAQPHGILLWRGLMQWLGGIGIIAFFLGAMPLGRVGAAGASAMYEDEMPGPQAERVTPRLRGTIKTLWQIYLFFTLVELLLLLLVARIPLFDALTTTLSTVASGGYHPRNASVGHYDSAAVDWIVTTFMVLAGVNFGLYFLIGKRKIRRALADTELRVYLGILAGLSLLVTLDLLLNGVYTSPLEALRFGTFEVVSQQTGTGFATADYDTWSWFAKALLLLGMFIGGSSGSTCGGLKILRLIVVAKYAHRQIYSVFSPRVVLPLKIGGRVISDGIVKESVGFFIVYQSVFLFSILALTGLGLDLITAVGGTAATVGIVGPGLGQVGPTLNYADTPDLAKLVFIFNMYVGRLDLWTVLILLRPAFWRAP